MEQAFRLNRNREMLALWCASLAKAGSGILTVQGGSMEPVLPEGTQVMVAKTDPSDVQPGDVIVIVSDDTLVTHRVIDRHEVDDRLVFVEKGDAEKGHRTIDSRSIIAKVVAISAENRLHLEQDPLALYYGTLFHLRSAFKLRLPAAVRRVLWWLIFSGARLRIWQFTNRKVRAI